MKKQEPRRVPGLRGALELGPVGLDGCVEPGHGRRRVDDAEPGGHHAGLGHVEVRLGS